MFPFTRNDGVRGSSPRVGFGCEPGNCGLFVWVGVTLKRARKVRWQQKWQHLRLAADVATANPMQSWATRVDRTEDQKEGTGERGERSQPLRRPGNERARWTGVLLGRLGSRGRGWRLPH